jgi:protein TonB
MKPFAKSITGIPYGVLSAMMVTLALFLSLPLLTRIQPPSSVNNSAEPIFINPLRHPPPPPETEDVQEKQSLTEKEFVNIVDRPDRVRPKVDIPRAGIMGGREDGIPIPIAPSMEPVVPIQDPTYRPDEVDQQPVLLRSFPFQYPYLAKRDNIEGWVTLRFIVDVDGSVKNVAVTAAEPVGIFEEAALKAVHRYTFKPAVKNGEAVSCMMLQRIRFGLE